MNTELIQFETHLTVHPTNGNSINEFIEFCSQSGGKALLIELPQGDFSKQLMMSKYFISNNLESVLNDISKYTEKTQEKGFEVNRVKIEVDAEFSFHFEITNEDTYFEWHCKIEIIDFETISQICSLHNAHLSKNSLKGDNNLRFITLREFGDKNEFETRIKDLVVELVNNNVKIIKERFEFCVYDTNIKLDKGWNNK